MNPETLDYVRDLLSETKALIHDTERLINETTSVQRDTHYERWRLYLLREEAQRAYDAVTLATEQPGPA